MCEVDEGVVERVVVFVRDDTEGCAATDGKLGLEREIDETLHGRSGLELAAGAEGEEMLLATEESVAPELHPLLLLSATHHLQLASQLRPSLSPSTRHQLLPPLTLTLHPSSPFSTTRVPFSVPRPAPPSQTMADPWAPYLELSRDKQESPSVMPVLHRLLSGQLLTVDSDAPPPSQTPPFTEQRILCELRRQGRCSAEGRAPNSIIYLAGHFTASDGGIARARVEGVHARPPATQHQGVPFALVRSDLVQTDTNLSATHILYSAALQTGVEPPPETRRRLLAAILSSLSSSFLLTSSTTLLTPLATLLKFLGRSPAGSEELGRESAVRTLIALGGLPRVATVPRRSRARREERERREEVAPDDSDDDDVVEGEPDLLLPHESEGLRCLANTLMLHPSARDVFPDVLNSDPDRLALRGMVRILGCDGAGFLGGRLLFLLTSKPGVLITELAEGRDTVKAMEEVRAEASHVCVRSCIKLTGMRLNSLPSGICATCRIPTSLAHSLLDHLRHRTTPFASISRWPTTSCSNTGGNLHQLLLYPKVSRTLSHRLPTPTLRSKSRIRKKRRSSRTSSMSENQQRRSRLARNTDRASRSGSGEV